MEQFSLPGFEVLGKIGEGGMASVWKARQLSLDRLVSIKVLSAHADWDSRHAFAVLLAPRA